MVADAGSRLFRRCNGHSSNLAITEINYHPYAPTTDEIASGYTDAEMFEFIELKNIGSTTIDLTRIIFPWELLGTSVSQPTNPILAPGNIVVLVANAAAFDYRYGSGIPIAGTYRAIWITAVKN